MPIILRQALIKPSIYRVESKCSRSLPLHGHVSGAQPQSPQVPGSQVPIVHEYSFDESLTIKSIKLIYPPALLSLDGLSSSIPVVTMSGSDFGGISSNLVRNLVGGGVGELRYIHTGSSPLLKLFRKKRTGT